MAILTSILGKAADAAQWASNLEKRLANEVRGLDFGVPGLSVVLPFTVGATASGLETLSHTLRGDFRKAADNVGDSLVQVATFYRGTSLLPEPVPA